MDLEKMDSIVNELEQSSKQLKGFTDVYAEVSTLQSKISQNLELIKENNNNLNIVSDFLKRQIEENTKQLKVINDFLEQKIEEIYKDNKAFQKELDSTLLTRLEKHKSDIHVDLRNEGAQIQRAFETKLNSIFIEIESKFKTLIDLQSKEIQTVKFLNFILIIISLGIGILLLLK